MPPVSMHFNGGINLPDTDSVLRAVGRLPHDHLRRISDGETGERRKWIGYQVDKVLAADGLVRVEGDVADHDYGIDPVARLADGTDASSIAWPDLGYAAVYSATYQRFRELRSDGVLPRHARFQAQYPTPEAVANLFHPEDRDDILASYRQALLDDLARLTATVPHEDLAVQWDAAVETAVADMQPDLRPALGTGLAELIDRIDTDVAAGLHLCYGDSGHERIFEPSTLGNQVALAASVLATARRSVDWLSFTVPSDRSDDEFFAPLRGLHVDGSIELYFSLVAYDPDQQKPGTVANQVQRIDAALGGRPWGVCTPCGMGRVERSDVARLLDTHREIVERFGPVGASSPVAGRA